MSDLEDEDQDDFLKETMKYILDGELRYLNDMIHFAQMLHEWTNKQIYDYVAFGFDRILLYGIRKIWSVDPDGNRQFIYKTTISDINDHVNRLFYCNEEKLTYRFLSRHPNITQSLCHFLLTTAEYTILKKLIMKYQLYQVQEIYYLDPDKQDDLQECIICYQEMHSDELEYISPCRHQCCKQCLYQYYMLASNVRCFYCRQDITILV